MKSIFLLFIGLFLLYTSISSGCTGESGQNTYSKSDASLPEKLSFPYNLEAPDSRLFLPAELEEISGISYITDNTLACIQDEKGIVFIYSLAQEKIIREDNFATSGDYEDVAIVNGFAYILKSDGQIWKMPLGNPEGEIQSFNTPLSAKNDVEGMAYDAASNRLLLACKGISGIGKNISGIRAIYAFDLHENKLIEEPAFSIKIEEVKQLVNQKTSGKFFKEDFRPSGIAIHPVSGEIYVLASVGKVLIVLNKNGSIEDVQTLNSATFKQPEGISFSPDGSLFISNEGRGGRATILQFNYANQ